MHSNVLPGLSALAAEARAWMRDTPVPLPGSGKTAERWRVLARAGAWDLCFAKIFESHLDALAILAELGEPSDPDVLHAVWASELPSAPVIFDDGRISGRKGWCSGAEVVDEALVSAHSKSGERVLVRVPLRGEGIRLEESDWSHPGMSRAGTRAIAFEGVLARQVGEAGSYLDRPGFWHGGAGIAAVWFGGATAIAEEVRRAAKADPHMHAHLGRIHGSLEAARALLGATARGIDERPNADSFVPAMTLRLVVERAARETIVRGSQILGPARLARNEAIGTRIADLEMYLGQSHGERDLAALGKALLAPVAS